MVFTTARNEKKKRRTNVQGEKMTTHVIKQHQKRTTAMIIVKV